MNAEIDAGTPKLCGFRPARAISRPIHYLEIYNLWHSNAISARIHYFEIDMFDERIQTTWFWGAFTMWKSTISTQKSQPILVNRLDIGKWTQSIFGNRPFSTKNMILRLIQPSEIDEKQTRITFFRDWCFFRNCSNGGERRIWELGTEAEGESEW